jgi:hypothetical protein
VSEEATLRERQGAVRLAMCDALSWTDPTTLNSESFTVLAEGIEMLDWTTFSEADEEAWLERLLEARWNLGAAVDPTQPADREAA